MRRPSAAIVIATTALVFSTTGAGLAAGHYLITSTSQIKPSVVKALRGKPGPAGIAGAAGATGAAGTFAATDLTPVLGPATSLCTLTGGPCSTGTSVAQCPTGTTVISGGFIGSVVGGTITTNGPSGSNGWSVSAANESTIVGGSFQAVAECAS